MARSRGRRWWPFGRTEERASPENPATSLSDPQQWLVDYTGGGPTASGLRINEETALRIGAVYACIRVISETMGTLPLHLIDGTQDARQRVTTGPLVDLMKLGPNPYTRRSWFFETLVAFALSWGNGYAWIEQTRGGRPLALWLLQSGAVTPRRLSSREVVYEVALPDGRREILPAHEVLHLPALGFDGLRGRSPIRMARETIGLAGAAQEFGARFFGNDLRPGIVLTMPGRLSDDARARLKTQLEQAHAGLGNKHKALVAEDGMTVTQVGIPPEDAQFLETRKFQRSEIAGLYRVPPHMIGDLERATFSNIAQQDLAFAKHTILPWLVKLEQELNAKLLPAESPLYWKFSLDGLVRGDLVSRTQAYHNAILDGWMSRNEVRALEDLPPVDGLDEMMTPANMNVGAGGDEDPAGGQGDDGSSDDGPPPGGAAEGGDNEATQ